MKAMWKVAIVLAVAGAVAGTLALRGTDEGGRESVAGPPFEAGPALPRLVDLGADKCIPCQAMTPILDELREEYTGTFEVQFIDVWKNPKAGEEYGVQMIPTQIFLDADGNERFRHTGFLGKEDILAKWQELGVL